MKLAILAGILLQALAVGAQDRLPESSVYESKPAYPQSMKPGDYACVVGLLATAERHVFVWPRGFRYEKQSFLCLLIQKTNAGWKLWLKGAKVLVDDSRHDQEERQTGGLLITEMVP